MVKKLTRSASSRRAKVIALIQSGQVHSQSDLVALLEKSGFEVTQATASRDLDEIGAMRGRANDGTSTYVLPESTDNTLARVIALPSDLILSVEASGNLAVVRTPPGGAQLLASALDRASRSGELSSVIGTIAGDDTVLVVSKRSDGGASLAKELSALPNSSGSHKSRLSGIKVQAKRRG